MAVLVAAVALAVGAAYFAWNPTTELSEFDEKYPSPKDIDSDNYFGKLKDGTIFEPNIKRLHFRRERNEILGVQKIDLKASEEVQDLSFRMARYDQIFLTLKANAEHYRRKAAELIAEIDLLGQNQEEQKLALVEQAQDLGTASNFQEFESTCSGGFLARIARVFQGSSPSPDVEELCSKYEAFSEEHVLGKQSLIQGDLSAHQSLIKKLEETAKELKEDILVVDHEGKFEHLIFYLDAETCCPEENIGTVHYARKIYSTRDLVSLRILGLNLQDVISDCKGSISGKFRQLSKLFHSDKGASSDYKMQKLIAAKDWLAKNTHGLCQMLTYAKDMKA